MELVTKSHRPSFKVCQNLSERLTNKHEVNIKEAALSSVQVVESATESRDYESANAANNSEDKSSLKRSLFWEKSSFINYR